MRANGVSTKDNHVTISAQRAEPPWSIPRSARLVGHETLHSGRGIARLDPHTHQNLNYLGRGITRIEVRLHHVNAGKPILCVYPRRRGLRVASYATGVTLDASVGVSRRRPDQLQRGDQLDGDGRADRRNDVDKTHDHEYHK
jgi:hypothetical protein